MKKDPFTFQGKNALILGAGAIGDATALRLSASGARILGVTKSVPERVSPYVAQLQTKLGAAGIVEPALLGMALDVTDPDSRAAVIAEVTQKIIIESGGLDLIVVATGGINKTAVQTKRTGPDGPPPKEPADAAARDKVAALWETRSVEMAAERQKTYGTIATGPLHFLDEIAPALIRQERSCCVITICSAAPHLIMSGVEPYCEAKAALLAGTQSWGVAMARARVNLGLAPVRAVPFEWGWSIGEQNRPVLFGADGKPTWRFGAILDRHPGGAVGTVEQIADAILFIASHDYVNIDRFTIAGGGISYGGI